MLKKKLNIRSVISLNCFTTQQLKKNLKKDIFKLKNEFWKYNLNNQKKWFKENIKKKDLHNCLFSNNKLIGYTCLRRKVLSLSKTEKNYLLFDTLIINKKFKNKKLGTKLMSFNNKMIKKTKLPSFLITRKKIINFYKKNRWKLINKNFFFLQHKMTEKKFLMGINFNNNFFNKEKLIVFL